MPTHEIPQYLHDNPKLCHFSGARGNMDGSQFDGWITTEAAVRYLNRKGYRSQNVLAASDYENKFIYILSGWEGSAADSRIFDYTKRQDDLKLPRNCYFLADAGFPLCDMLMTPYRGKRYHLKEWAQGNQRFFLSAALYSVKVDINNFLGQLIMKNYSICVMLRHEMLLSASLVFLNADSSSWHLPLNTL